MASARKPVFCRACASLDRADLINHYVIGYRSAGSVWASGVAYQHSGGWARNRQPAKVGVAEWWPVSRRRSRYSASCRKWRWTLLQGCGGGRNRMRSDQGPHLVLTLVPAACRTGAYAQGMQQFSLRMPPQCSKRWVRSLSRCSLNQAKCCECWAGYTPALRKTVDCGMYSRWPRSKRLLTATLSLALARCCAVAVALDNAAAVTLTQLRNSEVVGCHAACWPWVYGAARLIYTVRVMRMSLYIHESGGQPKAAAG